MRRLIDANTNREKFKEIVYRTLNDCNITTKKKFNIIMTAFDNMPTAYDIEKVVAELDKYLTQIVGRKAKLYTTIIDIVKAGGKNERS